MNQPLISFLNRVISDIQENNINSQQILHLSSFYCNYTFQQNQTNSTSFSPSIYDLLTAGFVFYDSLTNQLDTNLNIDDSKDDLKVESTVE